MGDKLYYTVYKITNLINGKFYIGKHATTNLNDGYMGSGRLITKAIKKYGVDNFTKEILHIFTTETEMNESEKQLVVLCENSYNLCPGGSGGFGYINNHPMKKQWIEKAHLAAASPEACEKRSATARGNMLQDEEKRFHLAQWTLNNGNGMLGKSHSDETKTKMSGPRGKYNVQKTGIKRGPYKKRLSK